MKGPDDMRERAESEQHMAAFEQELGRALQRVEAPEGFADRVMERALAAEAPHPLVLSPRPGARLYPWTKWRVWSVGAIAAALAVGYFGAEKVQERREQQRAVVVEQQFDTAMRVTDHALNQTRAQLARAGFRLSQPGRGGRRPQ